MVCDGATPPQGENNEVVSVLIRNCHKPYDITYDFSLRVIS